MENKNISDYKSFTLKLELKSLIGGLKHAIYLDWPMTQN